MLRQWVAVLALAPLAFGDKPHARTSPDWVRSAVIYEINTRTFSPAGNFRGIEDRLPDLQKLGVTILWLMPIHPAGQAKKKGPLGSPYAVRDYDAIEPSYGSAEDLRSLVRAAHKLGFRIIIDIVANHTAWDSVLMKHPDWYKHDARGAIISPNPDWTDVAALNYANPDLRRYMTGMLVRWIRDFDLDGFRCDVADQVPLDFWIEARHALEQVKPQIIMIAEAHNPELLVEAFDLDYAWPFHNALNAVFQNGAPAMELKGEWQHTRDTYPTGAMEMRFSDNHDEKRAIARFGERGALAASALVFTLDGVPMIYNGMEAGDTTESGAPALFFKLPVFWDIAERRPEFPAFYTQMIALRRAHPALQQGETQWVDNAAPDRVLTFFRRDGKEEFLVAVNCSNRPFLGGVDAVGMFVNLTPKLTEEPHRNVPLPVLSLEAWGFRIVKRVQ